MNHDVANQLARARTALIIDQPFFGMLALRLRLVEDSNVPTMAVDGKHIFYNPEWTAALSSEETKGLLAHEVGHCIFEHIGRKGDRDHRKWNQAGDYVINDILLTSGFQLPADRLHDPAYAGMTTDHVYSLLPDGTGGDPLDNVLDGHSDSPEIDATDWKIAAIQSANAAKQGGKLSGSLERFIDELISPKVDWKAMLRRFVTETSKDDYSWMRPNRRFINQGFYLPSLYSETMGEIVVAIDTSGSIGQDTLNAFGAEIKSIVAGSRPSKTTIIYCDSEVNHVDEFMPNDELAFAMHGGGGTAFKPVMDYVSEKNIAPVCLVYLTDLYGQHDFAPPDYPVLWCCTTDLVATFGETIPLDV